MRLLNVLTKNLEEFSDQEIPPYAILSHTWGKHEVIFKDFKKGRYKGDSSKIEGCCKQAIKDGLGFVWVDTCCIDKSSSTELSEAINSMYAWYRDGAICYAYLNDFHGTVDSNNMDSVVALSKCRWFTRGWTLQELLAPRRVAFYNAEWEFIGAKTSEDSDDGGKSAFNAFLSAITSIPIACLADNNWSIRRTSVAEKMSWASARQTTRVEDMAYSMLGIFGVNMPLLYGEKVKAFHRLQEAIARETNDQSILAWRRQTPFGGGIFADSPRDFAGCSEIVQHTPPGVDEEHFSYTNMGLMVAMRLRELPTSSHNFVGMLNCTTYAAKGSHIMAIPLLLSEKENGTISRRGPYSRIGRSAPVLVPLSVFDTPDNPPSLPIYIGNNNWRRMYQPGLSVVAILSGERGYLGYEEVYPLDWYPILHGKDIALEMGDVTDRSSKDLQQTICIRFEKQTGESFVLYMKYYYKRCNDSRSSFLPLGLEYFAGKIKPGLSLAALLLEFGDRMDVALNWAKEIELEDDILRLNLKTEPSPASWTLEVEIVVKQKVKLEDFDKLLGGSEWQAASPSSRVLEPFFRR